MPSRSAAAATAICIGSASLDHPEVSRGIVARKLANVAATGARVLASDNPGCLLHLRGAAHARGLPLEVRHVAELLALRLHPDWLPRVDSHD